MLRALLASAILLTSVGLARAQQPAPPPPEIRVPAELAQTTVTYLASRPYSEVAGIIAAWIKLAQQQTEPKKEPTP